MISSWRRRLRLEDKSESGLVTAKGGVYYIVRIDSIIPEHQRSFDEVKTLAAAAWHRQEREKHVSELAKTIAADFASEKTREAAIAQYKLTPAQATLKRQKAKVAK